jgi:hypothetical protein
VERDHAVDKALQLRELVRRLINQRTKLEFALIVEEIDAFHFAVAFASAIAAVVAYLKVFFAADAATDRL